VELEFEPEVLDYIVEKAIEFKVGARGLRSIVETIMTDAMFEVESHRGKLIITLDYAKDKLERDSAKRLKFK